MALTNDYAILGDKIDTGKHRVDAKSRISNDRTTALSVLKMYTDNATNELDRARTSLSRAGIPKPKVHHSSFTPTLASNGNLGFSQFENLADF